MFAEPKFYAATAIAAVKFLVNGDALVIDLRDHWRSARYGGAHTVAPHRLEDRFFVEGPSSLTSKVLQMRLRMR
jgi:hypothetical protein